MKKKQSLPRAAVDYGSPQLAKRLTVVPKLTDGGTGWHGKVMDETEQDRLLLADTINTHEHSILNALMARLLKANFVGIRSPSYEARLSADPSLVGDKRANAVRSMVALTTRMDKGMGRGKRVALVNLVLLDRPWPGDKDSLKAAVGLLAKALENKR